MFDIIICRSYTEFNSNWSINVESAGINSFMRRVNYGFNFVDYY